VCWGHFVSGVVGQFKLGNLRVRPDGRAAYCDSRIQVQPREGLWVELIAMTKTAFFESTAIAYGGDPSLATTWEDLQFACIEGKPTDPHQPCLLGGETPLDDTSVPLEDRVFAPFGGWKGHGRTILVREPNRNGIPYHLGVSVEPNAEVDTLTVRVHCDRSSVFSGDFNLTKGKFTVLGSVEFHEPSGCTFTPDGITSWETDEG